MASGLSLIVGVIVFCFGVDGAITLSKKDSTLQEAYLEYHGKWAQIAQLYQTDPKTRQAFNQIKWYHQQMNSGQLDDPRPPAADIPAIPFTCNPAFGISPSPPETVHELRPGDISVVAALGDSITAANGLGAENVLLVLVQNRGESWSIGGDFSLDLNVTTLPNILRHYNPDVKGQSDCTGGEAESNFEYAWFNVAVPGARATHMPEQATDLVHKMKNDARIVYAKDWKVVTLYIGGNDLCSYCRNRDSRSPANFKMHIQEALDILHDQVPRVFVNLVPMADVGSVQNVTFHHPNTSYPGDPEWDFLYPWICDVFHNQFCDCVMNDTTRAELKQVQLAYFDVMQELVDSGRYDTKDDFTVVLQPHQRDAVAVKDPLTGMTDNRYFSPDCFHPNRRMHQVFAFQLWNVMLTRVGEKPTGTDPEYWTDYVCPTEESPYLYTKVNSVYETEPAPSAGIAVRPYGYIVVSLGLFLALLTLRE